MRPIEREGTKLEKFPIDINPRKINNSVYYLIKII